MPTNRQILLDNRPVGEATAANFKLVSNDTPALADGQVLVRHHYLSLDPYMRGRMNDSKSYAASQPVGEVFQGGTVGEVVESRHPKYAAGDKVAGFGGWQEYSVVDAGQPGMLKKVDTTHVPLSHYLGAVGMPGVTAWYGLVKIIAPKEGETVVVSAAAGAVGSIVGQIAKIKGCRVVGLAGSDDKCRWVVDDLGFDACINYRKENVLEALRRECPKGIDVYFENVGGEILDAVLTLINLEARIPLCGLISTYNADGPVPGPYMFRNVLMKRALIKGFIVIDYFPRIGEFMQDMPGWIASGKVKWRVDVEQGLENAPTALQKLFTGGNTGKLVVQISPEP